MSHISTLVEVANALPENISIPDVDSLQNVQKIKRTSGGPYAPVHFAIDEVKKCNSEYICGYLPKHDSLLRSRFPETFQNYSNNTQTDAEKCRNEPMPELGLSLFSNKIIMICYEDREIMTVLRSKDDCLIQWGKTVVDSVR